jgi:2-polyprenyl-3-methyl-5-hydroxy-6-metoxy-1,4-benzoquinol methylase
MGENLVQHYGWSSADGPHSCGYITPRIVNLLKRLGTQRVLDLGSGNGKLCGELALAGHEVVGVEYDEDGVAIARSSYPGLHFYKFGVQDDPRVLVAAEGTFDAVVSTEVIEHLFSPHLLPRYARVVLKGDGYLIVTTPYHGYLKDLTLAVLGKWDAHHDPLWHGGHIKFWSRLTLCRLLRENGFEVTEFFGIGRAPYLWKSMMVVARVARHFTKIV